MESAIIAVGILFCSFVVVSSMSKYTGDAYSADFFGKKTAFVISTVPLIPEIILALMLPFWLMYWAIQGVEAWTRKIDAEWKKLDD